MRWLALLVLVGGTAQADDLDVGKWLEARGVSADPERSFGWQNAICSEAVVGPGHEAALECHEEQDVVRPIPGDVEPAYRSVDRISLRVVRGKKLVTLIDVPVKTFSLDAQPRPLSEPVPPWHPFVIAKDGLSLTVGDPEDAAACKGLSLMPGHTKEERIWAALRFELEGNICKARGRYVWSNGRFARR